MIAAQTKINGLDLTLVQGLAERVSTNPANGIAKFTVSTAWTGGTRSESRIDGCELGGKRLNRKFRVNTDEPVELGGTNTGPNPQEYLLAALNSCMMVGYVANASLKGVTLESIEIESEGELDLRGFLGFDNVKPGYNEVHYTVRIKGNGTPQQFREIHDAVIATSPNRWNLANPIKLTADLVVE